jgi:hypothetical protein
VWPSFNTFITTIGNVIHSIIPFAILLSLFVFSFTILGLEGFANTLRFNFDDKLVPYYAESPPNTSETFSKPDSNFDTFNNALLTVFVIITGDGWSKVYHNHYRGVSGPLSTLYFISIIILGQWILFNLLLANLLKEYDERSDIDLKR